MQSLDRIPGSDFYYAALYCPASERSGLTIINSLHKEIASIPLKVSDRGIARIKLNWWHEELQRFNSGTPQHRLSQAYLKDFGSDLELSRALDALISGLDDELNDRRFSDRAQQEQWFDTTFGPIYACLRSAHRGEDDSIETPVAFGRSIEMAYALLQTRQLVEHGLFRLPSSSLANAGCDWHTLEYHRNDDNLSQLIAGEADYVITSLKALTVTPAKELRLLATWARIMLAKLEELRRDDYKVWQYRIELTPVRKLWIAWRTRWFR